MAMELKSPAFQNGGVIPKRYTGEGLDVSPPLVWSGEPAGTKSFALICDDPDAPGKTWVHWVLYGIPPTAHELKEGIPKQGVLSDGMLQGKTDFGDVGYGGPMPPPGKPHRYMFKLYALDTVLSLKPAITKADLLKAIEGHVLKESLLMGTYQRK